MGSESSPPNAFHVENAVGFTDVEKEDVDAATDVLIRKGKRTWRTLGATEELTESIVAKNLLPGNNNINGDHTENVNQGFSGKYFFKSFGYDNDKDDGDFFQSHVIIPSRYTEKESIHHTFRGWTRAEIDTEVGGKWMLFFDRTGEDEITGLTPLDVAWQKIKRLGDFRSTGIFCASCSTACVRPSSRAPEGTGAVICCFTPDYTNKTQVKKAADSIRQKVVYPNPLFYKTDKATLLGKYKHLGHRYVSIYKHAPFSNRLYERSEIDHMWYPVVLEQETRW